MPAMCVSCGSRLLGWRSCKDGFFCRCSDCGARADPAVNPDKALENWNRMQVRLDREAR